MGFEGGLNPGGQCGKTLLVHGVRRRGVEAQALVDGDGFIEDIAVRQKGAQAGDPLRERLSGQTLAEDFTGAGLKLMQWGPDDRAGISGGKPAGFEPAS